MPGEPLTGGPAVEAFLFGKMPAHGDFVSRGLADETIEAGDAAIADAVARAIHDWDAEWDDVYVETPVWRFIATPGVLGPTWLAGVFMPSVDAVGRQFPLVGGFAATTMALLAETGSTGAALDAAEGALRQALLDVRPVDAVLAQLADIAAAQFGPARQAGDPAALFAAGLLSALEAAPWSPRALWWVAGGESELTLHSDGPLTGEMLAGLFRRAPTPQADLREAADSAVADMVSSPDADADGAEVRQA